MKSSMRMATAGGLLMFCFSLAHAEPGYELQKQEEIRTYSARIALNASDTNAYVLRGQIYYDLGSYTNESLVTLAFADFNRAVELDPNNAEAWAGRGDVFAERIEKDSAVENYTRAIDLEPEEVIDYYRDRAIVYRYNDHPDEAVSDYTSIIDLDSTDINAYESRAELRAEVKDYRAAIEDYTKAIQLDSTTDSYFLGRADACYADRQYAPAIRDYDRLIRRDSTDMRYHLKRGACFAALGQYPAAIADYAAVVNGRTDDRETGRLPEWQRAAYLARARAYMAQNQPDPAIADLTKYLALIEGTSERTGMIPACYWRGHAYSLKGEDDLAIRDYSKVIDAYEGLDYVPPGESVRTASSDGSYSPPPADSIVIGACFSRASIYLKRRDFDNARRDFGEVIRYDGKHTRARYEHAVLSYYGESYDSLYEDCQSVVAATVQPDVPYYTCSGIQSVRSGDYQRAVEFYTKGLTLSGRDPDLLNLRGDAFFHSPGKIDSALADWRQANTIDPRYPTFAAARETLRLSLDLAYPRSSLGVLLDRAQKAIAERSFAQALSLIDQHIQKYPQDASAFMFRVTVDLALGESERALADARTAVALSPDSAQGDMILGLLFSMRQQWDSAVVHLGNWQRQPQAFGADLSTALILGYGYYCLGDYQQAIQAYGRIPLSGSFFDSTWAQFQALAYWTSGDTAGAVRIGRTQPDRPLCRMILKYREGRMDSVIAIGRAVAAEAESLKATMGVSAEDLLSGVHIALTAAPALELEGNAWQRLKKPDSARVSWQKAHELSFAHPISQPGRDALGLGPVGSMRPVAGSGASRPVEPVQPLLPAPKAFAAGRPNGYALIVGLSKYQFAPPPSYGSADAQAFSEYVSSVLGIAANHMELLLDERATGGAIRGELIDWLAQKRGFKVIYFAGHGVPDPENPREGDVYLLPYDGNPERKSTLIPLGDVSELGQTEGDTLMVFLDACFSGAGEGRTASIAARPLVVSKIPESKAVTMAAAEGTQPSKEFMQAKHGYFTYYTLLGLKGKADEKPYGNSDGWVTTTELYDYVRDKVSDATNNVQVPVLRPGREIRIGRYR